MQNQEADPSPSSSLPPSPITKAREVSVESFGLPDASRARLTD